MNLPPKLRAVLRTVISVICSVCLSSYAVYPQHLLQGVISDSGDISRLIVRAYALRFPHELTPEYRQFIPEQEKCGLRIYAEIRRSWDRMNPSQRAFLLKILQRPSMQTSILSDSGHFRIHYDTSGINTPAFLSAQGQPIPNTAKAYIDSVASIFKHVWNYETNVMGYPPPPHDNDAGGGDEYDIYVLDLANQFYGDTTPEDIINVSRSNSTYTSYIRVDNDYAGYYSKGLNGLRVTAAHEFHHGIQLGNYGYWTDDIFFYELTSTWMEEVVYDEIDDYYQYLPSYFAQTNVAFNQHGGYDLVLWGIFLSKRYSPGLMKSIWEHMRAVPSLSANDQTLQEVGSGFKQELAEFALWNYFTGYRADPTSYYPESEHYPLISGGSFTRTDFLPPSASISDAAQSLSSQYYQVIFGSDTTTLILTNVNLSDALGHNNRMFDFSYTITNAEVDNSFTRLANGLKVRLNVKDPSNWRSTPVVGNSVIGTTSTVSAYPNPFHVDGRKQLAIPIGVLSKSAVSLYIFSSGLELVYNQDVYPTVSLGENVIHWDGRDNQGQLVKSGIYVFHMVIEGREYLGKLAVIR